MQYIRMPEAWSIQSGVKPIVVGVCDTGIDVGHPDFATPDGTGTRIIGGQNFFPDDGTNVVPSDIQDKQGHGTHVAGIIGATTNNSIGVSGVAGWNAGGVNVRFQIARVFGAVGGATDDIIASGINYLVSQNVDVINLSLGGPGSDTVEATAIANAISNNIVVVAALGNSSTDTGLIPFYPAAYPGVIAVSAINIDKTLASYSNFGGNVAIGAPGGDFIDANRDPLDQQIWSTWPRGPVTDGNSSIVGYNAISGTSMASPHVAGAVALLLAAGAPHVPATVKNILQSNAQVLPDDPPNFNGGNKYGAGMLDVYSSILPYADPPFGVGFAGPLDLGTTYASLLNPFTINAIGVTKAPPVGSVTLEIQPATIPVSVIRRFVDGTDFTIPRTIPTGEPKATVFNIAVPANAAALQNLAPGTYKAVLKLSGAVVGTEFFQIIARTQPQGRSLFSTPFKIRSVATTQPEQALFGPSSIFTLARYNPLRLPSDLDYAIFQSSGNRQDVQASFSATAPDGTPLVYDTSDPTTSIAPVGLGYWLDLSSQVTLNTVGPAETNSVAIRLFADNGGWNLIGAPFVQSSAWGTVSVVANKVTYNLTDAVANGILSPALVGYSAGDYVYNIAPNGNMNPFNGYWVRAYEDCTLIVAATGTSRAVSAMVPSKSTYVPDTSGWKARLIANVSGDTDGQNYFGQAATATDTNNLQDIPKPPSGAGHAYVRFITPAGNGRSVSNAFDIRSLNAKGPVQWTAAVSTDKVGSDVSLTWAGIGNAPHRNTLILTDTTTGQKVDMRSRSTYTFKSGEAGTSRMFTITMAPTASSGLLAINNVAVVSGRSALQPGVTVRFNVTAESEITGTIKNLSGMKVSSLTGVSRAVAGEITTLRWDGRSQSGAVVPPGPYMVEITARSADGQTATFKQPVQILH
jgi:subtilisin family serine protease